MMLLSPFEERVEHGGSTFSSPAWTSLEEEESFIQALAGSVRVLEVGRSVEGRPILLVSVGAEHAECRVLVIAEQHGNEPAGREGALMFLRDLATSEDPNITGYLTDAQWGFIITANPDRFNQARENANGVDLNRDHLVISQPETEAIHKTLHGLRPRIVMDLHETTSSHNVLTYMWPLNTNVNPMLREGAEYLCRKRVAEKLIAKGWSHGLYPTSDTTPRIFRNYVGLSGALGVLMESSRSSSASISRDTRSQAHRLALQATLEWDMEERARVDALTRRALNWTKRTKTHTVYSGEAHGYVLPENNQEMLNLHGVEYFLLPGEQVYASMRQTVGRLMPYLMDTSYGSRVVDGTRRSTQMPITRVRHQAQWVESLVMGLGNGVWKYW